MAKQRFRGALAAQDFPLVSILAGRTIGQPQLDQDVKAAPTNLGIPAPSQFNTPQLLYAENVLPTSEGFQSVGYQQQIAQFAEGNTEFDQAITLRDFDENNYLYVPARGKNYIWNAATGLWVSTTPFSGWNGRLVTRAYVNGRTFVAFEGRGIYEYDATAGTFDLQVITGLANADVKGIGGSSNYLIVFTYDLEVHWSSLVDPLDFVPSLSTGAGFSIPQDVKGAITAVLGISGGFIIYTVKNAIAAVYTNNVRAPFTFKEIANAGGIQTYEQVTSEQTSGAQYAWTTGGLQKITVQSAEPVSAEINDFIAGRMWETFDPGTKELTVHYSETYEFPVKLSFISSRFLVISYSVDSDDALYNYAIVYDVVLKRYGKLKVQHSDCFSYPYPNVSGNVMYSDLMNTTYDDLANTSYFDLTTGVVSDPPSKLTVAFLSPDGTVNLLRMDYDKDLPQQGVFVLGHFQLVRSRMVELQWVDFEGVYQEGSDLPHPFNVTCRIEQPENKGSRFQQLVRLNGNKKVARWAKRCAGLNFDLIGEGTFALSTVILETTNIGSD